LLRSPAVPSPPATQTDAALWTLEEIGRLVSQRDNAAETLSNVVHLIQRRFETDVCSVYLLEPDRANLVLAATIGLRPESIGRVRMRLSEGLAGLVAEQLAPQCVADAATHPRFKYFADAGEDPYRSVLGVPVIDRGLLQGVLVVQTTEPRVFDDTDVRMLLTAGTQLASVADLTTVMETNFVGNRPVVPRMKVGIGGKNFYTFVQQSLELSSDRRLRR